MPIRPQARPVSPYARPEVRASNDIAAADRLAGIARALSKVAPEVERYTLLKDNNRIADAQAEAQLEMVRLQDQYENATEIRKAVEAGELHRYDNPYTTKFLGQMLVRQQVRETALSLGDLWESDPEFKNLGEAGVMDRVDQELNSILEGASPVAIRDALPEVQRVRETFQVRAADYRRHRLKQESLRHFAIETQAALGATPDLAAARIQQSIEAAVASGHDPAEIRQAVISSVADHARQGRSEGLLEDVLSRVQMDGVTLDQDARLLIDQTEEKIAQDKYVDEVNQHRQADFYQQKTVDEILDLVDTGAVDRNGALLSQLTDGLSREGREALEAGLMQMTYEDGVRGMVSGDDMVVTAAEAILMTGGPAGVQLAMRMKDMRTSLNKATFPAVSDLSARARIHNAMNDPQTSPSDRLTVVAEAFAEGQLTKSDYEGFVDEILQHRRVSDDSQFHALLGDGMTELENRITDLRKSTGQLQINRFDDAMSVGVEETKQTLDIIKGRFRADLHQLRINNPQMTPEELEAWTSQRVEELVTGMGGVPREDYQAAALSFGASATDISDIVDEVREAVEAQAPGTTLEKDDLSLAVSTGAVEPTWDGTKMTAVDPATGETKQVWPLFHYTSVGHFLSHYDKGGKPTTGLEQILNRLNIDVEDSDQVGAVLQYFARSVGRAGGSPYDLDTLRSTAKLFGAPDAVAEYLEEEERQEQEWVDEMYRSMYLYHNPLSLFDNDSSGD